MFIDYHHRLFLFILFCFCGSPDLSIQGETHDSIEDARTALQLYRKYLDLSRGGASDEVRKVLKGLYEKGRQLDWKVPDSDTGDGQGSPKSTGIRSKKRVDAKEVCVSRFL